MKHRIKAWGLILIMALLAAGCGKDGEIKVFEDGMTLPKDNVETTMIPEDGSQVNSEEDAPAGIEGVSTEGLPIGSIVQLKEDTTYYMITAKDYAVPEVPDTTFEYAAFSYPIGNQTGVPTIAINHDDIEKVIYIGFSNEAEALNQEYDGSGDYLSIGTVVHVEGVDVPLMIFGRHQTASDGTVYSYSGCEYPIGFTTAEESYLFNQDMIQSIDFYGYCNSDELEMERTLAQMEQESN